MSNTKSCDMISRDALEHCLERLMKQRHVKSYFETAFDAADISMLFDDAVFLTDQPDTPE